MTPTRLQGVVLASGSGTRLQTVTRGTPKCLAPLIAGHPTVVISALQLLRAGAEEIHVVVRHDWAEEAQRTLECYAVNARVLANPEPERGSAHSLYLALQSLPHGTRALVACCDTLAPTRALVELAERGSWGHAVLAASRYGGLIEVAEASKIRAEGNRLLEVGKGLGDTGLYDMGLFNLEPSSTIEAYEATAWQGEAHLYQLFNEMVRRGHEVGVLDLGNLPWTEVDTPEDLELLERGEGIALVRRIRGELGLGGGSQED